MGWVAVVYEVGAALAWVLGAGVPILGVAGGVAAVAAVSYGVYAGARALIPDAPSTNREARTRKNMFRDPVAVRKTVYGRVLLSGPMAFAETSTSDGAYSHLFDAGYDGFGGVHGDLGSTTDKKNAIFHFIVVLADHPSDAVEDIFFGEDHSADSKFRNRYLVNVHLGHVDQLADPDLVAKVDNWTDAHRGRGITYLYVRVKADTETWAGIPQVRAVLRGKADVFDPRGPSSGYTNNWALCNADFLTDDIGFEADQDEVNWDSVGHAANVSDEILSPTPVMTIATSSQFSEVIAGTDFQFFGEEGGDDFKFEVASQGLNGPYRVGDIVEISGSTGVAGLNDTWTVGAIKKSKNKIFVYNSGLIPGNPGGTVTIKISGVRFAFAAPHKMTSGETIDIIGHSVSGYDGLHEIKVIDEDIICVLDLPYTSAGTGGTAQMQQRRYTLDGVVDSSQNPAGTLENMLKGGAGSVVFTQGKFNLHPGAYSPPVRTLTTKDLRDDMLVHTSRSRSELFNTVKGVYIEPEKSWEATEFGEITNSAYTTEDGEVIDTDLSFNFLVGRYQAQRVAQILLKRHRQQIIVEFPAKLTCLDLAVAETVNLTVAQLGWDEKVFKILDWEMTFEGVDLILEEEAVESYDWSDSDAVLRDPAPDTNLPDPWFVTAPTGLTASSSIVYLPGGMGPTSRVLLEWNALTEAFLTDIKIQYRTSEIAETAWMDWGVVDPAAIAAEIFGLPYDDYDFQIQARRKQFVSEWTTIYDQEIADITQAMPDVANFIIVNQGDAIDEFTGPDVHFQWDAAKSGTYPGIGGNDVWFVNYEILIYNKADLGAGNHIGTYTPVENEFVYTKEMNATDHGGTAEREFAVEIRQVGGAGQKSTNPAFINSVLSNTISNPAPDMSAISLSVTGGVKSVLIDWTTYNPSDADLVGFRLFGDTIDGSTDLNIAVSKETKKYRIHELAVSTEYFVKIMPYDAFGDGIASQVNSDLPNAMDGADVDALLTGTITMTDSDSNTAATLLKLYDRNKTSDGVSYTVSGTDKYIEYAYGIEDYFEGLIIHMADANASVYFGLSDDGGSTWNYYKGPLSSSRLVSATDLADAQANSINLSAGLNYMLFPVGPPAGDVVRMFIRGSYTTVVYEYRPVRLVVAEQVVADNLSAISANVGTLTIEPSGYIKSDNWVSLTTGWRLNEDGLEINWGGLIGDDIPDPNSTRNSPEGAWVTAKIFVIGDMVTNEGSTYACEVAHTSGDTDDEPGVGSTWTTYWMLFVSSGTDGTQYVWQGAWAVGFGVYDENDCVNNTITGQVSGFVCILTHTADLDKEPGVGASWATYWDLTAEAGSEVSVSGNNLIINTVNKGAVKNTAIVIGSNGTLYNAGGGSVTIGGLGYSGDLAATEGADWDVNLTNMSSGFTTALNTTHSVEDGADGTATKLGNGISLTAGGLYLSADSKIYSYGKTEYDNATSGWFLGGVAGTYQFGIGNSTYFMHWTGSALSIGGDIIATGNVKAQNISKHAQWINNAVGLISPSGWTDMFSFNYDIGAIQPENLEFYLCGYFRHTGNANYQDQEKINVRFLYGGVEITDTQKIFVAFGEHPDRNGDITTTVVDLVKGTLGTGIKAFTIQAYNLTGTKNAYGYNFRFGLTMNYK